MQAEGIFRINGENGQEEYIRGELNRGVVPENIDVHCLAGLIKVVICKLKHNVTDPYIFISHQVLFIDYRAKKFVST